MKENLLITIGGIIIAFLITLTVLLNAGTDREGPDITFLYDITYREGEDISVLLDGVYAFDGRDGDVTLNVIVDSLIVLKENDCAKATYIAKDNSNNITKVSRIVGYEGSGKSIYSASASELMGESTEETLISNPPETESEIKQSDGEDGALETAPEDTGAEEPTEVTEEATEEQTTQETTSAAPPPAVPEAPVLTLSKREATINAGDSFNIASCVRSITDNKDSRETLYRKIAIDGSYDTGTAGTYIFKVYCIDSDKHTSNKESFTLHVVD